METSSLTNSRWDLRNPWKISKASLARSTLPLAAELPTGATAANTVKPPSAEERNEEDGHGKPTSVLEVVQEGDEVAEDPSERPGRDPGAHRLNVRPVGGQVDGVLESLELPHHLHDHEQRSGHG